MLGRVAEIERRQLLQRAQEESGADEQYDGHRELPGDKTKTQPSVRARRRGTPFLAAQDDAGHPRRPDGGNEAGRQARPMIATPMANTNTRGSSANMVPSGKRGRRDAAERDDAELRDDESESGAARGEHGTFGQELPDQSPASRAERDAHRELVTAGEGA